MFEAFRRLPIQYQGIIFIVIGVTAALYALGIIEKGINTLIVLFAACMIVLGCIKIGLYQKVMSALKK